jgi:hypothetical protein
MHSKALSTVSKSPVAGPPRLENSHPCKEKVPLAEWPEMSGDAMSKSTIKKMRDDAGATTAEYSVCTGAAVGFAGILFKFLTSSGGQHLVKTVFDHVLDILPF